MKQNQREVLTKERQVRLATRGGPPPSETNIDPDIAIITPHLLKTAPVLFSSNMTENEICNNEEHVVNALKDNIISTILCEDSNDAEVMTPNAEILDEINKSETFEKEKTNNKENQNPDERNEAFSTKRKTNWDFAGMRAPKLIKGKKHTFVSEDDIKIERIQLIMDQEKEIANIRKVHEKKFTIMKEELHALEMRAALAKAELAELQLRNEKESFEKRK